MILEILATVLSYRRSFFSAQGNLNKIFFISVVLSACSPVYIPNSRNSPMFTSAREFQATASFMNGLEAQAALSFTDHIGIIANFAYTDPTGWTSEGQARREYLQHRFFEGGIGYYRTHDKIPFEIFVGYGEGKSVCYEDYDVSGTTYIDTSGKYNRYFVQPAFGFNRGRLYVSVVPRLSLVDMTELHFGSNPPVTDNDPIFFFEPAVVGKLKFFDDRVMYVFQVGYSSAVNKGSDFDHRALQVSNGIGFRLGGSSKQKSQANN